MRRPVLQVVNSSAIAWILAGGLAIVWAGFVDVPFTVAFPTAAMIVGGLCFLGEATSYLGRPHSTR